MNKYRQIYTKLVCDIPKDFDIHHIDGDKKNNDIRNLLMLPKDLHRRYHFRKRMFENNGSFTLPLPTSYSLSYISKVADDFIAFQKVRHDLSVWVDKKEHTLMINALNEVTK